MRLRNRQEVQLVLNTFRRNGMNKEKDAFMVLLSEIDAVEGRENKNLSEEEIQKIIRKQCESLKEIIKYKNNFEIEKFQLELLEYYLPTMASEEETEIIVKDIVEKEKITEKKQFGLVMKSLPKNVDKKIASKILNDIL